MTSLSASVNFLRRFLSSISRISRSSLYGILKIGSQNHKNILMARYSYYHTVKMRGLGIYSYERGYSHFGDSYGEFIL
jgi:hypothetical protein